MKRLIMAAALGFGVLAAPTAHAAPIGEGCVSDFWMWQGLRASTRVICDGDRAADGSWERRRGFFADAYTTNGYSSCYRYGCTYYPPRFIPELKVMDTYRVTDATVLPDEPGWIASAEPRVVV